MCVLCTSVPRWVRAIKIKLLCLRQYTYIFVVLMCVYVCVPALGGASMEIFFSVQASNQASPTVEYSIIYIHALTVYICECQFQLSILASPVAVETK